MVQVNHHLPADVSQGWWFLVAWICQICPVVTPSASHISVSIQCWNSTVRCSWPHSTQWLNPNPSIWTPPTTYNTMVLHPFEMVFFWIYISVVFKVEVCKYANVQNCDYTNITKKKMKCHGKVDQVWSLKIGPHIYLKVELKHLRDLAMAAQ